MASANEAYLNQLHPAVVSNINIISSGTEETSGVTRLFCADVFERGVDNKIQLVSTKEEFLAKYGDPNMAKYGQAGYNICKWLENGGDALILRVLPEDAKYAHAVLNVRTQVDEGAKKNIRLPSGKMVTMDDVNIMKTTSYIEENSYSEKVLLAELDKKMESSEIDNYKDNFIFAVYPFGRGSYYNRIGFRITNNPSFDNVYEDQIYNFEVVYFDTVTEEVSILEGPFFVSFNPDSLSYGEESLYIEDVINRYSEYVKLKFNQEAFLTVAGLINPEVNPYKVDILNGRTRIVNDEPETFYSEITRQDEDIHTSLFVYDTDGDRVYNEDGSIAMNIVERSIKINEVLELDAALKKFKYATYNKMWAYMSEYYGKFSTYKDNVFNIRDDHYFLKVNGVVQEDDEGRKSNIILDYAEYNNGSGYVQASEEHFDGENHNQFKPDETYYKIVENEYVEVDTNEETFTAASDYYFEAKELETLQDERTNEIYENYFNKNDGSIIDDGTSDFETLEKYLKAVDGRFYANIPEGDFEFIYNDELYTAVFNGYKSVEGLSVFSEYETYYVKVDNEYVVVDTKNTEVDPLVTYYVYTPFWDVYKGVGNSKTFQDNVIVIIDEDDPIRYILKNGSSRTRIYRNEHFISKSRIFKIFEVIKKAVDLDMDHSLSSIESNFLSDDSLNNFVDNIDHSVANLESIIDKCIKLAAYYSSLAKNEEDINYTKANVILTFVENTQTDIQRYRTNKCKHDMIYNKFISIASELTTYGNDYYSDNLIEDANYLLNKVAVFYDFVKDLETEQLTTCFYTLGSNSELDPTCSFKKTYDTMLDKKVFYKTTGEYIPGSMETPYLLFDPEGTETPDNIITGKSLFNYIINKCALLLAKLEDEVASLNYITFDDNEDQYRDDIVGRCEEIILKLSYTKELFLYDASMSALQDRLNFVANGDSEEPIDYQVSNFEWGLMNNIPNENLTGVTLKSTIRSIVKACSKQTDDNMRDDDFYTRDDVSNMMDIYKVRIKDAAENVFYSKAFSDQDYCQFECGSEGSFSLDLKPTVRARNIKRYLIKAYTGGIDEDLINRKLTEFDHILDANYDTQIKYTIYRLATEVRKDFFFWVDTNTNRDTPDDVLLWRKQEFNYDSYFMGIFAQDLVYRDNEFTNKDLEFTTSYVLASKIPYCASNYGLHLPIAGSRRGLVEGYKSINWIPNESYKELLYNKQINYIEKDPRKTRIGSQSSATVRSNPLSNINAMVTLLNIKKDVERICDYYQFEFNDSETKSALESELNDYLRKYTSNRSCEYITCKVYASDYDKKQRILRVNITIKFTGIIERIFISLDVVE